MDLTIFLLSQLPCSEIGAPFFSTDVIGNFSSADAQAYFSLLLKGSPGQLEVTSEDWNGIDEVREMNVGLCCLSGEILLLTLLSIRKGMRRQCRLVETSGCSQVPNWWELGIRCVNTPK